MALLAVLVSFLFTTTHWWKMEKTAENRLKTLPLLLLQCYPQYKAVRVIYLWLKDDQSWLEEKLKLERDIATIGKTKLFRCLANIGHPSAEH